MKPLNGKKTSELEQIISDIADSGASPEALRRVEELLLDDPALQDFYWEMVSVHTSLPIAVDITRNEFADSAELAGSIQVEPPIRDHSLQQATFPKVGWGKLLNWQTLSAIAALFFCAILLRTFYPGEHKFSAQMQSLDSTESAIHKLPVVSSVSWEGPHFENGARGWGKSVPSGAGIVPLEQSVGRFDEGYLLCLPPGASMTIVAVADATGENCLSITEIVSNGTSAIRRMSFVNSGEGPKPKHANPAAINKRYGMLGRWSEFNHSSIPRYFLLTGVYRPLRAKLNDEWRISRMSLILQEPTVTCIGWDDSWKSQRKIDEGRYRQDGDFDDLNATIFFSLPGQPQELGQPENPIGQPLVVLNDTQQADDAANRKESVGGFTFSLAPDEIVVLKVSTWTKDVHRMLVTHAVTGESVWDAANQLSDARNLGAVAIKNATTDVQELSLEVVAKPEAADQNRKIWKLPESDVLYQQPDFQIIGFDDGSGDKDFRSVRPDDFSKVRVNILRYRGTLSAMGI